MTTRFPCNQIIGIYGKANTGNVNLVTGFKEHSDINRVSQRGLQGRGQTRVDAVSNTSTVTLRVVEGTKNKVSNLRQ
jgi:hypothetical protein